MSNKNRLSSGSSLETQQVKLSGVLPPLTGRLQITHAALSKARVKDCMINQTMLQNFHQQPSFKVLGDQLADFPAVHGCFNELSYLAKKGFVMNARIFSGLAEKASDTAAGYVYRSINS